MRIKTLFAATLSVTAIMGLLSLLVIVLFCVDHHRRAVEAYRQTQSFAAVARLMERSALERGEINTLLNQDSPADQPARERMEKNANNTRSSTEATLAALAEMTTDTSVHYVTTIQKVSETLAQLRQSATAATGLPLSQRSGGIQQSYTAGVTSQSAVMAEVLDQLQGDVTESGTSTTNLISLARAAIDLRLWGGQRTVLAAQLIASGKPADQETLEKMAILVGKCEEQGRLIKLLMSEGNRQQALQSAVTKVKTDFFEKGEQFFDRVLNAARTDGHYPMSVAEGRAQTTGVLLPPIPALREAAFSAALDQLNAERQLTLQQLFFAIILILATISVYTFSGVLLTQRVLAPLAALGQVIGKLAGGDTAVSVPGRDRTDEFGALAHAVETLRQGAAQAAEAALATEAMHRERERHTAHLEELCAHFDQASSSLIQEMAGAASSALGNAHATSDVASEVNERASTAAHAASDASSNVQTVAAATDELATSISEISLQVTHAAEITSQAVEDARQTTDQINSLAEAANRIGNIVNLIYKIASQTNLLAMNATIEAARAGETGKGFAVVADEVKGLANQTAKATEEISSQVRAIQSATSEAVQSVENIGNTIGKLDEVSSAIAAALEEQEATTNHIAQNIQLAADGTSKAAETVSGVAELMIRTLQSSKEMVAKMSGLGRQADNLTTSVSDFLRSVR